MEPILDCSLIMGQIVAAILALACLILAFLWKTKWYFRAAVAAASLPMFFGAKIVFVNLFVALNILTFGIACSPFF